VPPLASEKPALWRRWGISLAVALLLHAVIATVLVLAWRKFAPPSPPGPVIVELPPPEAQPNAEPAEPTFATTDVGRSDSTERTEIDHPFAQLPSSSKTAEGESEPTFAPLNRDAIASAPKADENAADARTASGGGGGSAAPSAGISGPIDTRISPSLGSRALGSRAKKPPRKLARDGNALARLNKQAAAGQGPSRRLSALGGSTIVNAIGAHVEDRVRAAMARANASGNGVRNAVGGSVANNAGSVSANAAASIATNAIGMAVRVQPNIAGSAGGELRTGAPASAGNRAQITGGNSAGGGGPSVRGAGINAASIVNGTNMGRSALGMGAIGGPARNTAGVLNGTDFHPRHP